MIKEIASHKSTRKFQQKSIPSEVLREILEAGVRASTVGNMQLYSIVVTSNKEILNQLAPLHFNQPAVTTAPVIMTFCADINRFNRWCQIRGAEPGYDNFCWFMKAAIDSLLASQNITLEAQAHSLGICYLGTTLYNAGEISELLKLPKGVLPVMALSMGYPEMTLPLTTRLPLEAVVHFETYNDYTDQQLEELWKDREASQETLALLEANNQPSLAHVFTENRYPKKDNVAFSRKYFNDLIKQGFFNQ